MDECQVSVTGYVATQPQTKNFESGASNVSMRVAWTDRRQDRVTGEWMDGNTSYVTVYCWRKLGTNVAVSLRTGDPVVVKGRLVVRTYEDNNGNRRNVVDIDASSIGHDLSRGVSKFMRVRPDTGMTAAEFEAARAAGRLPSSEGNGSGSVPGAGLSGTVHGAGEGEGLRFSGGLESANGLTAVPDLPEPVDPEGWDDGRGEADDGRGEADHSGGLDLDGAEPSGPSDEAAAEAGAGETAEMAAVG